MSWRETLKNLLIGTTAAALIASGAGSALADDKKEITVPIGQVVKEKKLSAEQMFQDKVTVPMSWVDENYLEEHGYTSTSEEAPKRSEREELSGKFGDINHFWLGHYDGDDSLVEGIFVDNKEGGTLIAPYPFGEQGGDSNMHNTIYRIPGGKVSEVRSGDIDGDGREEGVLSVNTTRNKDNAVYTLDFDSNQNMNFDKYPAPEGKMITDVQVVDGRPFIVTNDENSSSDFELNIYQLEGNKWKPFLSEEAREGVLDEISREFESFHPKNLLMGNWDSDGEYEVIVDDGKDTVYVNDGHLADSIWGRWDWMGDLQEANYNPHKDTNKEILTIPTEEAQETYNQGDSDARVGVMAAPTPVSNEIFSSNEIASALAVSGEIFTDFQVPWKKMQLPGAEEHVGSKEWVNYWGSEYNYNDTNSPVFPYMGSTTNKIGSGKALLNTGAWDFDPKYNENFHTDFDFKDFPPWADDADMETLE